MIPAFDRGEIEAVSRLDNDEDFQLFRNYLQKAINKIALKSMEMSGIEGEKVRGGGLALAVLRDNIDAAKQTIELEKERKKMTNLDRDPISP